MIKKSLLLTLLLALLVPWAAKAQETITIGDGTNFASVGYSGNGAGSAMGNPYNYYATAQFIYTAEELAGVDKINSAAFYHNAYSFTSTVKIYLAHTTANTVDAANPATTGTLVYTGTNITLGSSSADWQVFEFDSPFEYNGTDNLLVVVCRSKKGSGSGSSYNDSQSWQYTATTDNKFMSRSSDSSGYDDITNTSYSYTASVNRPNIKMVVTLASTGCDDLETLTIGETNPHDVSLSWTGGNAPYNVEIKGGEYTDWHRVYTNNTTTSCTINGLAAQTAYQARVQSVCGTDLFSNWKTSSSFTTPVACPAPTSLQFVESTTTTAKLSWTENGSATEWQICLNEDETNLIVANSNPFTIPGLTAGTSYTAKVRAYCDDIDQSTWSNTENFDTQCEVIPALGFSPNFETFTAGATMPICWSRINEGASNNTYPRIYSTGGYTGSKCLCFYCYGSSSSTGLADQYAVLPEMSGLDGLQLTFMAKYETTNQPIKIGLMTDPTDASTFQEIATQTLTTTYTEYNFMLSDKGSYVAFMMPKPTVTSSASHYIYIDDITIHTPPTCIKPTNLAVEPNALTATVTWESDASQWQVAHSMDATANPSNNIEGTVNTKSYTKGNMDLGDHYFWVRTYCSTTDQSDWVGPVSVHIGYCEPNITSHDSNGITGVAFGTGDDIVNHYDEEGIPSVKPFYGDYSSMIGAVQAGVESTIAITTNTGSYPYTFVIWVDLDNSLSFEDSEVLYVGKASSGAGTLNATITIPAAQTLGDYRMRIFGADSYFTNFYNGGNPDFTKPHDPCADGTWRHACDFTVRVLEAPSCLTPTGLALNASGHTLQASWDGTATSYNIDINGTVTNNVTSPYAFNVELSTTYTVKVQANCAGDQTSDWSNSVSYTTPSCWGGHIINYTLTDSYNDGWEGAYIQVIEGCGDVIETLTVASGQSPKQGSLTLCGEYYRFVYTQGSYPSEYSWTFTEGGTTIFSGTGSGSSDGQVLYTIGTTTPIPTDLDAGTPGKHDATLSWTENGTATTWQICLNHDEEHLIEAKTNPYTLENLDPQTDYTVKVRAYIDATHQSCWSDDLDFTTEIACAAPTNFANETPGTNSVVVSWTENGSATEWEIYYVDDMGGEGYVSVYDNPFTWTGLNQDTEYAAEIRAVCGGDDGSSQWSNVINFSTDIACARPTNLTETNITTKGATLSWTGTSDSYVVEYRPWHQVGTDQLATGLLTTYNYDLSGFTGTGSIAIRHYDVSDMFMLNVDDIVVRNASNAVIYSQDFESGSIPSNITNMDLDGDGNVWVIRSNGDDALGNPSGNGTYCVSSASWISGTGAVYPDNWLIISGIEFGGSISFVARGQDPQWPAENFAVYASLESDIVEVPVASTSYEAKGLEANTPYAWQVYGVCGKDHSRVVSSFFKTLDDRLVFATDGDWDDLANWTDINGTAATALPTSDNNVRIDADATIPAGVVAKANKAAINGGSITIEDGGQLKHASASLEVTLYKGITGYAADKDNYYLISTPFSGVTMLGNNTWSHITNIGDNTYDLYGFDATHAGEEWMNWKSSSTASVFESGTNYGLKHTYGYLYANSADIDLEFIGTAGPTNVNRTYSVTYDPTSTAPFNGFALVGNPFTCNAYLSFVPTGGTPSKIDFYVMNSDGDDFVLSETKVTLAPMQGAFIWTDADGDVTFSSEEPSTNTGNNTNMLNISLTQGQNRGGMVDQARIRFGQGFNLAKMSFNDNDSKLYIPQDNKDFAVVHAESQGEMPVNFKAAENGTYTISFNSENIAFRYLHLIDNMTGNEVDLLQNPSYSFDAQYTDYASRFKLMFATDNTSVNDDFAFISNGNLMILGIDGKATVQVIDVTGRILSSEIFNGSYNKAVNEVAGVYMIRLIQDENVRTQKIVVK